MNVVDAIAHAMKAEGIDMLFAYPVNPLIEAAAKLDIRTIIVRQERIGLHMADAYSRLSSGDKIGVLVQCQKLCLPYSSPSSSLSRPSQFDRSRLHHLAAYAAAG